VPNSSENGHTFISAGIDCETHDGTVRVQVHRGVMWHEEPPETSRVPVVRRFDVTFVASIHTEPTMIGIGDVMRVDDDR
jgi:hypothetical protein